MQTSDTVTAADVADLERLGTELTALGYRADVRTIAGRLPYLDVLNPSATVLTEKVYVQAGWYWWSWAERIAGCDEPARAAGMVARVLRTVDRQ